MVTTDTTLDFKGLLALCELGRYSEALAALDGNLMGAERWLIEGAVLAFTEPEKAKDLLSKAADGLSGEYRVKAQIWLSCCYWATGEIKEATAIIDSVEPQSNAVKFLWAFTKAAYEIAHPDEALNYLRAVENYADEVNPLWRGKFHNQRGAILRKKGETDRAIVDYEAARYWFEEAENPRCYWGTTNNLAGILSDRGEFTDAHAVVDEAIQSLTRLGDYVYLAQAHDQKARIFLAEKKHKEAGTVAPKAINLLEQQEQKELLARSLLTQAEGLTANGRYLESFTRLDRALKIAKYLDNHNLTFDVSWELRELASKVKHTEHVRLLTIALEEKSIRKAAAKMKIQHPAFLKAVQKHGLERKTKTPIRRILNSRKK